MVGLVGLDITGARLHNQGLSDARFTRPQDAVRWLVAVQAQDYAGAKWALALRMRRATDAAVERAFAAGAILRTHVMRPTWHFVTPADIRWMLALTAPRVKAAMASYNRRLGLDAAVFRRSHRALARALRGGTQLTRQELKRVLQRAGVHADGVQRLAHLMMEAELDGVICSGARRGKEFTYALLDERVPPSRPLARDEALAELTRRYFTSRGPAQVQDFAWWSGLTMADARAGLALVDSRLAHDIAGGKTYWFSSSMHPSPPSRTAYLLPLYDEYLIAYKDRSAALALHPWQRIADRDPFASPLVIGGRVAGGWQGTLEKHKLLVRLTHLAPTKADVRAIGKAARAYADFLGIEVEIRSITGRQSS
jgi:hypothetical protein